MYWAQTSALAPLSMFDGRYDLRAQGSYPFVVTPGIYNRMLMPLQQQRPSSFMMNVNPSDLFMTFYPNAGKYDPANNLGNGFNSAMPYFGRQRTTGPLATLPQSY